MREGGARVHMGEWGGDSAVQPHSMGGVMGGERRDTNTHTHTQEHTYRNTHTHTHTQEHTQRGTYTRMLHLPFSDLPLESARKRMTAERMPNPPPSSHKVEDWPRTWPYSSLGSHKHGVSVGGKL